VKVDVQYRRVMGITFSSFSIRGIDTSTYNGVIDWSNMPAHFAAHRVGYGRTLDNKFNINWANCKINKFGYWYMDYYNNHISTHPVNGMSDSSWGKEQAENCYKFMGCNSIVFLDIESTIGNYAPKIESVRTRVLAIAKAFLIRIDQLNGKKNGIYCSLGLLDWFDDWFKDRPLWVAWYPYRQYNTSTSAIVQMVIDKGWKVKPLIWQYASDGIVNDDGIKVGITYFKTQMDEMDLNGWVGTQSEYESMFSTSVVIPDDETVTQTENTRVIPVKTSTRIFTLRKSPKVENSTFIKLLPPGKKLDCLERYTDSKGNTWQRVGLDQWVAEVNNGITYLK
jgi:GH25 family lysozyme M1 (1,4-beta-N-acetylmuramidase)